MTNYNKVKNEGVEEFRDFYWEKGQYKGRKLGIEQYESFLSTYAEKVHKATLEDVLEFVGEDEKQPLSNEYLGSIFSHGLHHRSIAERDLIPAIDTKVIKSKNELRQRIRDYIKTLTK